MSGLERVRESPKLKLSPLRASPSLGQNGQGRGTASTSISSPAKGHARGTTSEVATPDGLNTPTGGRFVRREIENAALSRKPSPLKKKEVLSLWEK